jgi:hypothetical protein
MCLLLHAARVPVLSLAPDGRGRPPTLYIQELGGSYAESPQKGVIPLPSRRKASKRELEAVVTRDEAARALAIAGQQS